MCCCWPMTVELIRSGLLVDDENVKRCAPCRSRKGWIGAIFAGARRIVAGRRTIESDRS